MTKELIHSLPVGTILWAAENGEPVEPNQGEGLYEYTVCVPIANDSTHAFAVRENGVAVTYVDEYGDTVSSYFLPDEFENGEVVVHASASSDSAQKDWNRALIELAIGYDKAVEFTYAKGDGRVIESRSVTPFSVTETANGAVVVTGFDPDREDVRAYRLDKIKGQVRA